MGAVAAAAVVAGGAYLAGQEAKRGAQAQAAAAERALNAFQGVPIPSIEDQKIILNNPELVGQYTPEQVEAMQLSVSAMEGVQADQGIVDSQKQALEGISEVAKGGLTEGDKAAARDVNREVGQQAQARRAAILNQMSSRGVLGSGMELAAQLQGEQQSIDQASRGSDALIQQAQARALSALGQQGQLAGQMRQQGFGEQSDIARARDAISQFNLQNRQNTQNTNVGNRNQAQMYNLSQAQAIENQRAAIANQMEQHNKALLQTRFANQMGKAGNVARAEAGIGDAQAAQANANAAQIQGVTQGIGTMVGSFGKATPSAADVRGQGTVALPANNYQYDPNKMNA